MFGSGIELKTEDQIRRMRRSGLIVAEVLSTLGDAAAPGMTTRELDRLAREILASHGALSSFLNYGADWGIAPYPAVTCISVNEEIVHGIPGDRVLQDGDIVSVDFGAVLDGWHGDAARTFLIGDVDDQSRTLSDVTREALWAGIGAAKLGHRIGNISQTIEASITSHGRSYGIVREYTGHGIGSAMHQPPDVPNHGRRSRGAKIAKGLCIAIEPMVTLGTEQTVTLEDDWTVVTADRSRSAHWENTITVTKHGIWVLTEADGGEAELTARSLPFGPLAD